MRRNPEIQKSRRKERNAEMAGPAAAVFQKVVFQHTVTIEKEREGVRQKWFTQALQNLAINSSGSVFVNRRKMFLFFIFIFLFF